MEEWEDIFIQTGAASVFDDDVTDDLLAVCSIEVFYRLEYTLSKST